MDAAVAAGLDLCGMWRRFASVCLVWLSLSGLLPAAVCVIEMQMQDATQGQGGCHEESAPSSGPVQLECCALDHMAGPTALGGVDPTKRTLLSVDALDQDLSPLTDWVALTNPATYARGSPPLSLPPSVDQSLLWLTTARLRL